MSKKDSIEVGEIQRSIEPQFTVFSTFEKYVLVVLSSSIAFWSSIGSPIYYPALDILKHHFKISEEMVNLSIVVYMLCQGISPSVCGGLADRFGRRPVLLANLVIFIIASCALACIDNYTVLLILRCIQSCAISPAVAISAGVVGDYTQRHERGWYVGLVTGLTFIGQGIGALVGAVLIQLWDWRAIFWFLGIGGGVTFLVCFLFLVETKRSIVGNGSIKPDKVLNIAPILLLSRFQMRWGLNEPDLETKPPRAKSNFFATFKIVGKPEVAICLFNGSIHYTIWVVLLTCLTTQLHNNYGYSVMKIGVCYLPAGIGGSLGTFIAGRLMNWNYKRSFDAYQKRKDEGIYSKGHQFNIVKARAEVSFPLALITDGFGLVYGWCLYRRANISVILISEFFACLGAMAILGINTTMLVDLYPQNSSAASSAQNLTRCCTSALFVAILTRMNGTFTIGGTFTFLSGVGMISTAGLLIPMRYGMRWIKEREARKANKGTV